MALLIPVLSTMHKPPSYIPKSWHLPYKQLMGQWGQVLKSWIKKASKDITNWRATWQHRQVLQHNCTIAHKHSAHCMHMQPQAVLVLQVLVLTATTACCPEQVYFDTDSHSIGIDNWCSACISHDIANCIDTPRPIPGSINGFGEAKTLNVQISTIRWQWEDDQGMVNDLPRLILHSGWSSLVTITPALDAEDHI